MEIGGTLDRLTIPIKISVNNFGFYFVAMAGIISSFNIPISVGNTDRPVARYHDSGSLTWLAMGGALDLSKEIGRNEHLRKSLKDPLAFAQSTSIL